MLFFIILLQGAHHLIKNKVFFARTSNFQIDAVVQKQIDSLKLAQAEKGLVKMRPFNPNFISDYKGYVLGMSPDEINRLHAFRATDKYVNSPIEFQQVTQISDSLLGAISTYFKFPDWTKTKGKTKKSALNHYAAANTKISILDLNAVTAEELKSIYGIGEKLSARIIKFRDRLGGFLVNEQLYDVYGLEAKVVLRTLKRFQVIDPPDIKKININTASADELASLIYIRKDLARRIIVYRQLNGSFGSLNELVAVAGFPKEKIERIKLYLSL